MSAIHTDPRLSDLWIAAQAGCGADPAHDLGHIVRVACWTCQIMAQDGTDPIDPAPAIGAALLHDMVNLPKDHPDRASASQRSANKALTLFIESGFSAKDAEGMADAIRTHSYSRGEPPTTLLGRALQDADRLDALGAIGIFRCIATTTRMHGNFFDLADPWATSRALDDTRFSIDHALTKLIRLPAMMTTATGKLEAAKRLQTLHSLLIALGNEIGSPFLADNHG